MAINLPLHIYSLANIYLRNVSLRKAAMSRRNTDLIPTGLKPSAPIMPKASSLTEEQKFLITSGSWPIEAFDLPVNVYSRFWLSGIAFNEDLTTWCKNNGFTHIINASGKCGRVGFYKTHPSNHGLQYLELDMDDAPQFNLNLVLDKMYSFVVSALESSEPCKILFHCMWGQSRSVSCLIYFMMQYWGIKYDDALSIIRQVRPFARPNRGFELQLRVFETRMI